ncbi:MAG: hypothetical protein ACK5CL_10745 [Sphingomonadales bacterium]|jgi:hypothetical protein
MVKPYNEQMEILVSAGQISEDLGVSILNDGDKESYAVTLIQLAIDATESASLKARQLNLPVMYAENGILYRQFPNGIIEKIKNLPVPSYNQTESLKIK